MKTNTLTDPKNSYSTNQEVNSLKVEIGDADIILSYMRKESYKYHLRTAIQEYISNALDAHREVKQTKKVIISAPTYENLTLIIKDFGPGLSPERIEKVWTQVGNSSKRENNKQKGGFGAGSKTLWAYTDIFLINTVVNGLKYEYEATVARKAGGEIILKKEPYKTSEPNGTEIKAQIHPNDVHKAQEAIKRFCFFCEESEMPEVLNLKDLKTVHNLEKTKIGLPSDEMDSAFILQNEDIPHSTLGTNSYDKIIFVLDGIPYVVEQDYKNLFHHSLSKIKGQLIVKFKTGVIKPQLSREAIMVCDENTQIIKSVSDLINKKIQKEIDYMLKDSTNIKDFMKNFFLVLKKYSISQAKFKDYTFNSNYIVNSEKFNQFVFDYRYKRHSGSIKKENDYFKIDLNNNNPVQLFYGDLDLESESKMGRRINEVLLTKNRVLVIKKSKEMNACEKTFKEMIELFDLKSIHEIEPKEIERQEKEKKIKASNSYNLHIMRGHSYGVNKNVSNYKEEHLKGRTVVYLPLDEYSKHRNNSETSKVVNFFNNSALFCFVGKEELKRLEELDSIKLESLTNFCTNITLSEKEISTIMSYEALNKEQIFAICQKFKLNPEDFKNKQISKLFTFYKNNSYFSQSYNSKTNIPSCVSKLYKNNKEINDFLTMDENFSNILRKNLPLLSKNHTWTEMTLNDEEKTDLLNYINLKTK